MSINYKDLPISSNLEELVPQLTYHYPVDYDLQYFSETTFQSIDWHWHNAIQYCYVLQGEIQFKICKFETTLTAGDAIFVNAKQAHCCLATVLDSAYGDFEISPYFFGARDSFIFRKFAAPLLYNEQHPYLCFRKDNPEDQGILHTLRRAIDLAGDEDKSYDLRLLAAMIELWQETLDRLARADVPVLCVTDQENTRLKDILYYLNQHYPESITLQDIADHIHVSRNECSKFFHTITGEALFSYLNNLRLEKGAELLSHSDESIFEIAMDVGFASQSYFCKCFQKKYNLSPKAYRQAARSPV